MVDVIAIANIVVSLVIHHYLDKTPDEKEVKKTASNVKDFLNSFTINEKYLLSYYFIIES